MSVCPTATSGGKGNAGFFYEREPRIYAAGVRTAQPDETVAELFNQRFLQDEADAIFHDAIIPTPKIKPLPPLRRPIPPNMRFAGGFGHAAQLVNPPIKTKFQTLVDDFKDTAYQSYWKGVVGKSADPIPGLPKGFDIYGTTMGKKTPIHGRLYDIVMPKDPLPDKTPHCQKPGVQTDRNYYRPSFDPNLTYGYRSHVDRRGRYAKCALQDDKVVLGSADRAIMNTVQTDFRNKWQAKVGKVLAPNKNIKEVPQGYSFGKLKPADNIPSCLSYCDLNPGRDFFKRCICHLNTTRNNLRKKILPNFFYKFYLNLKYEDKSKSGWLPKELVYQFCGSKLIRFDRTLIEPLLSELNAFDGKCIDYKTLIHLLNYREPLTGFRKIDDMSTECLDFRTTYNEMTKLGQDKDRRLMAGIPSGWYLDRDFPVVPDNCCKAYSFCLPHESDMKSCLNPSVMTNMNVSHRDMYAERDQSTVKQVFEESGEKFSDELFNKIWEKAQNYHPRGLVCYETFRRALSEIRKSSI